MTTVIEKGTAADTDELEQLYGRLHEHLGKHVNYPGWISGIYPARDTAESGIGEGCLYVARECGNREPGPIAGIVIRDMRRRTGIRTWITGTYWWCTP